MKCNINRTSYFMCLLIINALIFSGQLSAQEKSNSSEQQAGKTIAAQGTVNAQNLQSSRLLKRRSPVFGADTIKTEANSRTQLRMIDGGLLSLKQLSHLVISDYQFNSNTADGSVGLTLLKGGLRTVTGLLINKEENYTLTTPVASIGVRGTHYSAHMDEGDLLVAVWQGEIVVQVTVGAAPIRFELGQHLKYSMAKVKANGEVEFLLQVPQELALGHTSEALSDLDASHIAFADHSPIYSEASLEPYATTYALADNQYDQVGDEWVDNQLIFGDLIPTTDGISRGGSASFGLLQHSFTSSVGALSNVSMNLTVDFDLSRIPTGDLSFTDGSGEWFATFNGVINESGLDMNINFASHGNNLADGSISGLFVNNASEIFGELNLTEVNNSSVNAGGGFVLSEKLP